MTAFGVGIVGSIEGDDSIAGTIDVGRFNADALDIGVFPERAFDAWTLSSGWAVRDLAADCGASVGMILFPCVPLGTPFFARS